MGSDEKIIKKQIEEIILNNNGTAMENFNSFGFIAKLEQKFGIPYENIRLMVYKELNTIDFSLVMNDYDQMNKFLKRFMLKYQLDTKNLYTIPHSFPILIYINDLLIFNSNWGILNPSGFEKLFTFVFFHIYQKKFENYLDIIEAS